MAEDKTKEDEQGEEQEEEGEEQEQAKERKTVHIRARNKAEAWQSDGAETSWRGKQYASRKSGKAGGKTYNFSQK